MKATLLTTLMVFSSWSGARAFEPVTTDNSFNSSSFANVRYNVTARWNITGLVFVRRANGLADWQQYLFRPNIGYAINKHLEVGLGYTHTRLFPYGDQPVPMEFTENNVFQQLILRQKAGKVGLMHRLRLEQRFIDRVVRQEEGRAIIDGTNYAHRFRFRIDGMIPVALKERLFISLYDEISVHLQDGMLPDAFDQNRVYIGLGYQMNKKLRLELGVLHHYLRKRDGVNFESNPTMQMGASFQFGPIKRKTPEFEGRKEI